MKNENKKTSFSARIIAGVLAAILAASAIFTVVGILLS